MIVLWKGKNPIYFGVIRSKVKVTITMNRFVYRLIMLPSSKQDVKDEGNILIHIRLRSLQSNHIACLKS